MSRRSLRTGASSPLGGAVTKGPQRRADYLLRYTRQFSIAVVEAKAEDAAVGTGAALDAIRRESFMPEQLFSATHHLHVMKPGGPAPCA